MRHGVFNKPKKHETIKNPEIIKYRNRVLLDSITKKSDDMSISVFKEVVRDIKYLTIYSLKKIENIDLNNDIAIVDRILSTVHKYLEYAPEDHKNKAIKTYRYLEDLEDMLNDLQGKQNLEKYQNQIKSIKRTISDILDYASN